MEGKKYSFWEEFVGCFNPAFYKNIIGQNFSRSLRFLSIFLLLASLALTVKVSFTVNNLAVRGIEWIKNNHAQRLGDVLPARITIEKGIASTDIAQPYVKKLTDDFTYIIDTTGEVVSLDAYKNAFLLTKNKIVIKETRENGVARTEETVLSRINNFSIEPGDSSKGEIIKLQMENKPISFTYESLEKLGRRFLPVFIPAVYVIIFGYYWIAKLVLILIFSVVSLLANAIFSAQLDYRGLLNIGTYAIVAPTIIAFALILSNINVALFGLAYIVIYAGFLFLAVLSSKPRESHA